MKNMKIKKMFYSKFSTKVIIFLIFFMSILLLNKINPKLTDKFKENIFNKSINFIKINKISKKIIGKDVIYYQKNNVKEVMSDEISLSNKEKYFDGEKIYVSENLPIGTISSGVIVYVGNKENYGDVVIIQGTDGYNIWYGNLANITVKNYDYIEQNSLIGNVNDNYIYLVIEKGGKFYTYDEYKENKS